MDNIVRGARYNSDTITGTASQPLPTAMDTGLHLQR